MWVRNEHLDRSAMNGNTVGASDEPYLEDVKTFVLDHLPIVFQQGHAYLEVVT